MEKMMITVVTMVILIVGVAVPALAEEPDKERNWEIGVAFHLRSINLEKGGVPTKVRQEAANPSIVNPYSGRHFGLSEIGAFNPGDRFTFFEGGIFGKYTIPIEKSRLRPYLKLELQYPFNVSTHKGSYGEGYTYEKVLGGGVDYVRYIYGVKYQYVFYAEPEVGLSYVKKDDFSLSLGVSYQRLKLTYYKGLEAWGDPEGLQKLGTSYHNLFNPKLNFTKVFSENYTISLEPNATFGNGIKGWGIAALLGLKF